MAAALGSPLVSVCMPLYNTERFVEAAVAGVLAQTYRNIELIICDNGSTDRSVALVQRFAKADSRVHLVQNSRNLGYAGNLHKVLSLARGDFMLIHCADDLAESTALEKMVELAGSLPNAGVNGIVITDSYVANSKGEPMTVHRKRPEGFDVIWQSLSEYDATCAVDRFRGIEALRDALPRLNIVGWVGATMFSRKLFERIEGVYNGLLYTPDLQFNYHLLSCDPDIAWLREPLFYWRQHEAGHIGQSKKHAVPKHAWDGYTYTFHFTPEQLCKWGVDAEAIAYTFVDVLCLQKAIIEIRSGNPLLAFRHVCIGLATYPGITLRNPKFHLALAGLAAGPIGRACAQVCYRLWVQRGKS